MTFQKELMTLFYISNSKLSKIFQPPALPEHLLLPELKPRTNPLPRVGSAPMWRSCYDNHTTPTTTIPTPTTTVFPGVGGRTKDWR